MYFQLERLSPFLFDFFLLHLLSWLEKDVLKLFVRLKEAISGGERGLIMIREKKVKEIEGIDGR